jgi:hypothetical protein
MSNLELHDADERDADEEEARRVFDEEFDFLQRR